MAADRLSEKLRGILGAKTAIALSEHFGYETVGDLLRHYPRRYVVRGELTDIEALTIDEDVTIMAKVESVKVRRIPGRKGTILDVVVTDGRAKLGLTFFNQPWRERDLQPGNNGLFAGKVSLFKGKRQLTHPDFIILPEGDDGASTASEFAGAFLPVYSATSKLPSWKISQCIEIALSQISDLIDPIPHEILTAEGYPTLAEAFHQVHRPHSLEEADLARERLTFDEALLMQLFLVQRKAEIRREVVPRRLMPDSGLVSKLDQRLPFSLTPEQLEIWSEIKNDLASEHPMYRLLQGDVGSGKTIIALRAMLAIVDSGGQAALLAPTEVLAQQHYSNFLALLGGVAQSHLLGGDVEGTRVALLTGSVIGAERASVLSGLKRGEIGIVVGTHALLSEGVEFEDLGLIVVDEQHRFGVEQRDALRGKAVTPPHVLVMTATPIPRTVAMTVFGDLDISTLRGRPSGAPRITTHVVEEINKPSHMARTWERIQEEVRRGGQVYVVAPRITSSDDSDYEKFGLRGDELARARRLAGEAETTQMTSVEELFPRLRNELLAGLNVGMLHGRMSNDEKQAVMREFQERKLDVLVTTTVIEVGIDVPAASMMVIMDADRFGISQLHQLRGRIGRAGQESICLFVTKSSGPALERLTKVAGTLDGFELSRLDLEERREGDVLGSAQSGVRSHLRLLRVIRDEEIIARARIVAEEMIARDADLASHELLRIEIDRLRREEQAAYLEKK